MSLSPPAPRTPPFERTRRGLANHHTRSPTRFTTTHLRSRKERAVGCWHTQDTQPYHATQAHRGCTRHDTRHLATASPYHLFQTVCAGRTFAPPERAIPTRVHCFFQLPPAPRGRVPRAQRVNAADHTAAQFAAPAPAPISRSRHPRHCARPTHPHKQTPPSHPPTPPSAANSRAAGHPSRRISMPPRV